MPAFTGKEIMVEFAIAPETALVGSLIWRTLGMMRSKDLATKWDTADTTADMSPEFTKTSLVTFKSVDFTGDGVTYTDDMYNQRDFSIAARTVASVKKDSAKVWLRITTPNMMFTGPFIVSEYTDAMPYDGTCTWSMTANSNGAVTLAPI